MTTIIDGERLANNRPNLKDSITPPSILDRIKLILEPYPEAQDFVVKYNSYIHAIDDIIDEDKDSETILRMANLASDIFSSNFYVQNKSVLHPIEKMINNEYADSVMWERSNVEWKRIAAKTLRHAGLQMFYIVVLLVAGRDELRKISLDMREYTFLKHLED